jgi:actin-related protein 10
MGKDRRVLVVENVLLPTTMRQIIARTLFESLEVGCVRARAGYTLQSPCVLFAPAPLMACVPMRAPTALVIDCGHVDTVLVPVVNGICDLHRWQTAVGARELILNRLRTLLIAFATVHKYVCEKP